MAKPAMIFDFDGTIANTFDAIIEVLNSLSAEFGYRTAQPEEIAELTALGPRELAQRVGLPWHKLPFLATRVRKEMLGRMSEIQPYEGIPTVLQGLRERGAVVGMLTSNKRENVDAFLAHHPSLSFDFISAGSGLFSKDQRLRRLARTRGYALCDVSYVGDEVRDIEAARRLGVRMIAVGWGFSAPKLLAAHSPDHLIMTPSELLSLV
jgi:phosphoglycolate phosphatase